MGPDTEAAVIASFYDGVHDDGLLQLAIRKLATFFDSPSVCLGEMDRVFGRWMIGSGTVDTAQLARYAEISAHDPAPRAFSALRVCTASTSDRLFSEQERRKSAFLNEYLGPAGIDHSMGSPLHLDAGRFALIGIHQARHRPRFDDEDIATLERVTPHVARTLQLRRDFRTLRHRHDAFEALIDGRETGMVGMRGGRALFVNLAARATADGLSLDRSGRPVALDRFAATQLARYEASVVLGGVGGYVHVPRPSGASPYIVLVSRLPGGCAEPADGIGILFTIHDPARRATASDAIVADLLRLPRGPAKVVAALMNGQDLQTYAGQSGLSLSTVRCHLKAAFAQTETHSQTELVRLALSACAATAFATAQAPCDRREARPSPSAPAPLPN